MKFSFFLLLSAMVALNAQAQVKLASIVKPGSTLVYAITSSKGNYDFAVTLKDKKGTSFEWEMGSPADIKGKIIHTATALQSGFMMFNYFRSETKELDDQTLSVWISQSVFNALSKGSEPVQIGMTPNDITHTMQTAGEESFSVIVNGKQTLIKDKMVKPVKKEGGQWVADPTVSYYFSFNPEQEFPIILRMNAGFSLQLKEVKTH